jgi:hypothetical protein
VMNTVLVMRNEKDALRYSFALIKIYGNFPPLAQVGWREGTVIQFAPSTITPFRQGDPIRHDSKYYRIMRIEKTESDVESGEILHIIHFLSIDPAAVS